MRESKGNPAEGLEDSAVLARRLEQHQRGCGARVRQESQPQPGTTKEGSSQSFGCSFVRFSTTCRTKLRFSSSVFSEKFAFEEV